VDLLQQLAAEPGFDQRKAELALGMAFTAIRLSLDQPAFERIREGVPHVESWMGKALVTGGRTGEMIGLVGPKALERNLASAGLSPTEVTRLGTIVGSAVSALLRPDAVQALATKVPILAPR